MKNLKPFKVNEGDWGDRNPSAPWNQPEDPEPEAYTGYPEAKRDFVVYGMPGDEALLKAKSDGSLWVLDTADIEDEFDSYLYYYRGKTITRAEGYEEEEYGNIATDLFRKKKYLADKGAWDDRDGEVRLFKIDPELANQLIDDYVHRSRARDRRGTHNGPKAAEYKRSASILAKAFPEA